jgi:hypothetical protein
VEDLDWYSIPRNRRLRRSARTRTGARRRRTGPRRVLRTQRLAGRVGVRFACARRPRVSHARGRTHAVRGDAPGAHSYARWDSGVCARLDVARRGVSSPYRSRAGSGAACAGTAGLAERPRGSVLLLRGRPRGRLCVTIRPRSKIWPPQTPAGSSRCIAPVKQPCRTGQLVQSFLARSSWPGSAENHRSSSCSWQGSLSGAGWPSAANSNQSGPEPRR